jgi:acylpyruvate hydrolase
MKIIGIGRNYSDHVKEMNASLPTEPLFFLKPDTALLKDGNDFYYPEFTNELHYECELVIRIDKTGKNIAEKFAHKYYSTFSLGIDFTARDLQEACKQKGLPWEMAKAFEHSAPISTIFLSKEKWNLGALDFELHLNSRCVQKGNSKNMIFTIDKIISHVSKFMTLKTGDLIYTGTPAGVGSVSIGDVLEGFIHSEKMFRFEIK